MLIVETIAKIRRAHFVQGKPIKQICREMNLSRKAVRKVLRSDETAFVYKRDVQPRPKLGPWLTELDRLLAANAARDRRDRVTLLRIYEDLRGLGYEGSYDAVRRYASAWRRSVSTGTAAAFVPLSFVRVSDFPDSESAKSRTAVSLMSGQFGGDGPRVPGCVDR